MSDLAGRRATINDIARLAQVSKKTVSRVINKAPRVRPETRARVAAVIAEYGYAPDPQARSLASRRSTAVVLPPRPVEPVTRMLIEEARRATATALPGPIREAALNCALDWFGVTLAGADHPLVLALLEEAREQGGAARASIVRHGDRTSPLLAAMVNGAAADALDFSDTHWAMHGHPTAAVMAAAMAMAQARGATGAEVLAAFVAGVEVETHLGLAANGLHLGGFHPTGHLATIGATAACAILLGLDDERFAHALGVAATQSAGLLASGGSWSNPLHSGKAAMNGLLSANLAARGFRGRADAIEARQGFIANYDPSPDWEAFHAGRGQWLITGTLIKQHAACQLTHASMDALLALQGEHRFTAGEVRAVRLETPQGHLAVAGIAEPRTGQEAKFSLRVCAAVALLGLDTADLATYSDDLPHRPEVVALRDKVTVVTRGDLPGQVTQVAVDLNDGRTLRALGDTRNPLPPTRQRQVLLRKFRLLARPVVGEDRAADIERNALDLDGLGAVDVLFQSTVAESTTRSMTGL